MAARTPRKRTPAKKTPARRKPTLDLPGRERIVFMPERWSLADDEDFQEATGLTIREAFAARPFRDGSGQYTRDEKGRPEKHIDLLPRVVAAIIWIEKRHGDPTYTYDQARAIRKDKFFLDLDGDDEPDPKDKGTDESG